MKPNNKLSTLYATTEIETNGEYKGFKKTILTNESGEFKCVFPAKLKQPRKGKKYIVLGNWKYILVWGNPPTKEPFVIPTIIRNLRLHKDKQKSSKNYQMYYISFDAEGLSVTGQSIHTLEELSVKLCIIVTELKKLIKE
jgi:hypothetical protein